MKNYLKDFRRLFSLIGKNAVIFDESTYDREEDRPTYYDRPIFMVWLEDNELCFTTEKNGFRFLHEVDLIRLISLVNGEDMDLVALDYIFHQVLVYELGEEFESQFDDSYFDHN